MASDGSILLDKKRHTAKEFFINFFEYCNLSCGFCWQNHEDTTGFDTIVDKAPLVLKYIGENPGQKVILNLMGGELFADEVPNTVIEKYYAFVDALSRSTSPALVDLYWVTNLVFKIQHRALDLVEYCRNNGFTCFLTASYDPKGRFNQNTLPVFMKNFFEIAEKGVLRTVSVVLTKPNIQTLLDKGDAFLQHVHNSGICQLYFDTYSPESNHAIYAPTDKELGDILIWLCDHMPESNPVAGIIARNRQPLSCRTSVIVHPSGEVGRCGSLVPKPLYDAMEVPLHIMDNTNIEEHSLKKYDCLSCRYYATCGMGCFLLQNLKRGNENHECPYKRAFLHTETESR